MIFVIWLVIFVAGTWALSTYNTLAALRLRVQNGWQQINLQLTRRGDLTAKLVETVKGYAQFEPDTLQKAIDARSQAMASTAVKQIAEAQGRLSEALGKVFASMERHPDLQSNETVVDLQAELATTENRIAFARQYYNDLVSQFNTKQQVFPGNLIAGFCKFQPSEFFSTPEA